MEAVLYSKDADLHKVCREILSEVSGIGCKLTVCEDFRDPSTAANLHIWDLGLNVNLLSRLRAVEWHKHIILLQPEQLAELHGLSFPKPQIILKPFTSSTLRAFLDQAIARQLVEQQRSSIENLRADRDELLQCVIQANLKLQQYEQDRNSFLTRAIHDFRTPLTSMTGCCGLLLGEDLGPLTVEQRKILQRMQHNGRRLTRMANAMFELSKWQRMEQSPDLQKNDIRESIDHALHEVFPFIEEKRISVSLEVLPPDDALVFEKSQMEQVLINLLDNACRFTPRAGSIVIRGYPYFWERRQSVDAKRPLDRRLKEATNPNAFRVDIGDSGPGIPHGRLDSIFEEYTSFNIGQDRSGDGLGLAICKMILARYQGQVWAENTPSGVVFSFVLPHEHPRPKLHQSVLSRASMINAI